MPHFVVSEILSMKIPPFRLGTVVPCHSMPHLVFVFKVGDRTHDEHELESFFSAELIDLFQRTAFGDDLFGRGTQDRTHQQKTDNDTDRFGEPGDDDAGDDAEYDAVGC